MRMSQNANPSTAFNGMSNNSIISSNTTQTPMNISGMDSPDQVANNHLAEPMYIQTVSVCSIVLPEQEDNVKSPYKVDSYNVSVLLSSHWHYLSKNMLV